MANGPGIRREWPQSWQVSAWSEDGHRFELLSTLLDTGFGESGFTEVLLPLWRRVGEDINAPPPEFWTTLLQLNTKP